METKALALKATLVGVLSVVSELIGTQGIAILFLIMLMICDYITGVGASHFEKLKDMKNDQKGVQSSKGAIGILKKFAIICIVMVGISIDVLLKLFTGYLGVTLPSVIMVGMLLVMWFTLNEIISIIENCVRMEAPIPTWLTTFVNGLKVKVDQTAADKLGKS